MPYRSRPLPQHCRRVVPTTAAAATQEAELKRCERHASPAAGKCVSPLVAASSPKELEAVTNARPGFLAIGVERQTVGEPVLGVALAAAALGRTTNQSHRPGEAQAYPSSDELHEWCEHTSSDSFQGSFDPGFYG